MLAGTGPEGGEQIHRWTGLVFPTRRRVLLHDADGVADESFAPITVDVEDVSVS